MPLATILECRVNLEKKGNTFIVTGTDAHELRNELSEKGISTEGGKHGSFRVEASAFTGENHKLLRIFSERSQGAHR